MKVININSYYIGSSLYKHFEKSLQEKDVKIETFVPVNKKYSSQGSNTPNHVDKALLFNTLDRVLYKSKQKKIYSYFVDNYEFRRKTVLHAHSLFTNGNLAYEINKQYNVPYIVAVRNTDLNIFFKYMVHLRERGIEILKNARKIVFISYPYKAAVLNKYVPSKYLSKIDKKSVVLPNGIDSFWLKNKYKKKDINTQNLQLLFVGQLIKSKNLDRLVRACEILIDRGYKLRLSVVGEKISESVYRKIRNKSFIDYKGLLAKEKLLLEYRKSHIFVLPSKHETFGLVYPEAMSQGLPVVYTKNEGFDQYFPEGEVGYSVIASDSQDIANKIELIIKNYKNILPNLTKSINKFDWEIITNKYLRIYNSVMNQK